MPSGQNVTLLNVRHHGRGSANLFALRLRLEQINLKVAFRLIARKVKRMLNTAREPERREYQGVAQVQIGLVGPSRAGATGLIWSMMVDSGGYHPSSLFAETWSIGHVIPARPTERDLLTYLNPYQHTSLPVEQPKGVVPSISKFIANAVSGSGWGFGNGAAAARHQRVVEIFDTSRARSEKPEPGWVTCAYDRAPHIVLCHPINSEVDHRDWYRDTFERLMRRCEADANDRASSPLRSIVVAFTRYELAFIDTPRQALHRAMDPAVARECLSKELQTCTGLREGLRELSNVRSLRISGIPVSTYGFLAADGRPNYDGWLKFDDGQAHYPAAAMLTRPDIYCRALAAMRRDADRAHHHHGDDDDVPSRTEMDWLLSRWRPFLTVDPFIACISGDGHELVFPISDLLRGIPKRRGQYA